MLETVHQLAEDVAKAAAAPLWSLTDTDLIACLQATHRLEQGATALKARLVHGAVTRALPAAHGHRTTAGWLRTHLLLDPQPARDLADHAATLGAHPTLEQAVLDGAIDLRQATVIATTVTAIPSTLTSLDSPDLSAAGFSLDRPDLGAADSGADRPDLGGAADSGSASGPGDPAAAPAGVAPVFDPLSYARIADDAQSVLIEMAGRFPAYQLRRLGERILAHVAPEIADRADEIALRRQEKRAHRKRFLTLSQPVDGMVRFAGALSVEDAATVTAALQPLCGPIPGDPRTPGQRRADALVDVCRLALRAGELPDDGGEPPQVAVTIPFDPLTAQLAGGALDNGQRLSAESARRLACDARILPLVLGGHSQILDAGRSRRLATGPLRRALIARDRGCAFPDCDRPPRWCDAHHLTPWAAGGPTCLDNLVLLCRHHHRTIHDPTAGWTVRLPADRLPEFVPPPWTDPAQQPRRNLYHPRT